MDSNAIHNRLIRSYNRLKESRLVKSKIADEDSLSYFVSNLNNALPQSDPEKEFARIVRRLYYGNKKVFQQCLRRSSTKWLLLWTEGLAIVEEYGINELVYLKWVGDKYEIKSNMLKKKDKSNTKQATVNNQKFLPVNKGQPEIVNGDETEYYNDNTEYDSEMEDSEIKSWADAVESEEKQENKSN